MSRAEEAARRAELAASAERGESQKAQVLIDAFLAQARAKGLTPGPLRATLYSGQSVKTDKQGWYLRKNESLAIGEDGSYYILTVPGGLRERTFAEEIERRPTEVLRKAVKGMLPRNRLARRQLTKLKVYAGPEHPHEAQNPSPLPE